MRLRYAQLQKRQETMITDMERAIYKRDNIETKGKTMAGKKGAPPTGATLQKQTAELSKKLKMTTHDANLTQMNVLKLQEAQRERGGEVEALSSEVGELRLQTDRVGSTIGAQVQQQLAQKQLLARNHRLAQTLMAAAEGQYEPQMDPDTMRAEMEDAEITNQRLLGIIDVLGQEQPQYAAQLSVLAQTVTA